MEFLKAQLLSQNCILNLQDTVLEFPVHQIFMWGTFLQHSV